MKSITVALYFTILALVSAQPGYKYQQPQSVPLAPAAPPATHHHQHHHHHQLGPQPTAPLGGPIAPPQQNNIYSPVQSPPLQSFNAPPLPPLPQPAAIPLQPPRVEIPLPQAPPAAPQQPQQSYFAPAQNSGGNSFSHSHQQQFAEQQGVLQQQQSHFGGAAQLSQPLSFSSGGQGGFQPNFQQPNIQSFQPRPQTAIISKDIYIHSAPEDNEELDLGSQLDNVPVRKNYRIVFIKAPAQNLKLASAALKRAQNANEEKTVIYVLSKKPDLSEVQQQLQQAQGQQKSHKPEVYFIKYKTQEEALRAQQEIQAQYDSLGGSTHISDEGIAPVTSVSSGAANLSGSIGQQQSSFFQQNYQSAANYEGPANKYLPAKKK
ncbi:YLP motif-containing protein 1 [Anastrepha ludens]|uniref:YLP motif-containing protein 1 n=1 Tax=Anastrepha ludens TaxID=28586 RepID=UPI0023AF6F7F|nr:YLP motif-containing protein 1 [Anastrepha ludens]XP_053946941.1 YLP motif-containing protein 1 [Anastrepha ludens]XP_053946942.1 YLP motif-containing protein 1 [Anastrepha ludens]